ncbi:hypothetical protein PAEVO_36770 [Paenibacillus sp. GM2FR]|uniref:hypothetical protein n=1 Tax=Paenibacillus sp. GM2FR TaxID=2059268 RepID=UPI000C27473C|nr:hypothetical protein [Paenibacillus sp. GM2FR]PJN56951.1 hypothetical protein PAEVO_36770 [Paenibacillus sp. GM2FR]
MPGTRESDTAPSIGQLEDELLAELSRYEPHEQAAILKRMVNRLKKGRYVRSPIVIVKEMIRTPLVWLLLSMGVMIPILFYILFVWVSLAVEG